MKQSKEQRQQCIKQSNMINSTFRFNKIFNLINHLDEILAPLKINKDEYAIGGSVALLLYGGTLNRTPHDIDLIVNDGTFNKIKSLAEQSYLYTKGVTSSCDSEITTQHYAIKIAKGCIIDFIVYNGQPIKDASIHYSFNNVDIRVMDIAHLYSAKKNYHRLKDEDDKLQLEVLYNSVYTPLNESNSDLDALAALKAKMEEDES